MTETAALAVIAFLQTAFPRVEWREGTVALWVEELLAFDQAPALAAARACFRRCKFVPSMAEYLEQLQRLTPRLGHPESCVCGGAAMVQVDPVEDRWGRCPRPAVSLPERPGQKTIGRGSPPSAVPAIAAFQDRSRARTAAAVAESPDPPAWRRPDETYWTARHPDPDQPEAEPEAEPDPT